ncbi:hypothetical protein ABC498_004738 [Salmonella enterica]|nr:hypothetical protein [Salmonella enterica]EDL3544286.1 hypothetical protein [Salmonella enterica subsp. enterica serovar Newport]EGR8151042.1 hypothetical protein [Salmonella enterica subsp. enterica serovar Adelaide]MJL38162.1 hypothetical protein [Salmonella enterica subsp. enterica serovar Minnesota]ECW9137195.1 hypothetical protein [Salmonella enterica]
MKKVAAAGMFLLVVGWGHTVTGLAASVDALAVLKVSGNALRFSNTIIPSHGLRAGRVPASTHIAAGLVLGNRAFNELTLKWDRIINPALPGEGASVALLRASEGKPGVAVRLVMLAPEKTDTIVDDLENDQVRYRFSLRTGEAYGINVLHDGEILVPGIYRIAVAADILAA